MKRFINEIQISNFMRDLIPVGTFEAELESDQVRALRLVEEIGESLITKHPEIADLYRQCAEFETYLAVAQQYVPNADIYPEVASRAVGYAMRRLIPKGELDDITKARSAERLEDHFGGFDSPEFRAHCVRANRIRHESGIPVDTDAMVKARGRTPWTDDERQHALDLSTNPDYQHRKGRPNYGMIASELNTMFHEGKEVRYLNSVGSCIKDIRRKKK